MEPTLTTGTRRWLGLALLCSAFFMVILDVAIVNVALPSIQADLAFSPKNLQWVISAYALTFGGLLLLGGRAAPARQTPGVRRRRCGLRLRLSACRAHPERGVVDRRSGNAGNRGGGMTPAALSILMTTFREGADRNKALGAWGAVGASAGRSACSSAECSPKRPAGNGSSYSTCRSAWS